MRPTPASRAVSSSQTQEPSLIFSVLRTTIAGFCAMADAAGCCAKAANRSGRAKLADASSACKTLLRLMRMRAPAGKFVVLLLVTVVHDVCP